MDEGRRERRRQLRNVASSERDERPAEPEDDRAQSEVLGVALLIGLVVVSVTLLGVFGTQAATEQQRTAANSQAERSFEQLDTRASRVALGDESAQTVDLGLVDNLAGVHADERGWINVTVSPEESSAKTVTNTSLGTVYYERRGTTVAYQGGGIFRSDEGNVTMLSRPEFHFSDKTLNVPIVSVSGDPGLTDTVRVAKNGTVIREFPDASRNLTNRIQSGTVTVTVKSDYYRAWGRYFEDETQGVVTYDDSAEQVSVTFFGLPDVRLLDVGLIATSGTGQLVVNGNGPFPSAYIDSYDSSEGNYSETQSADGDIRSAGSVDMGGNSLINGSVTVGKNITVGSNAEINGSVEYTTTKSISGTVQGDVTNISGVESVPPIDSFVTAYAERIRENEANDQTPHITGNQLSITDGTTAEIGPGDYYLHNMSVEDDETLKLNTTNGDIRIAVRDWVSVAEGSKSGTIRVVGNGSVDIVVQSQNDVTVNIPGEGNRDVNFNVGQKGEIDVPEENSNRLTIFGPEMFDATIAASQSNPARFVGIIFAPAGIDGPGSVYVKHGQVYGLVATGNLTAGTGGSVHFDRGIDNDIAGDATVAQIEYLHANVHRVNVTSG